MTSLTCPDEVVSLAMGFLGRSGLPHAEQEVFIAVALDSKHCPIGEPWVVSVGTANSVEVHPRDVFREAVRRNAVAVVAVHNHPSGDPSPSVEDRRLTRRLDDGARVLGMSFLDHVVLGDGRHVSMAMSGFRD
jgi:DNA repair protein RadC